MKKHETPSTAIEQEVDRLFKSSGNLSFDAPAGSKAQTWQRISARIAATKAGASALGSSTLSSVLTGVAIGSAILGLVGGVVYALMPEQKPAPQVIVSSTTQAKPQTDSATKLHDEPTVEEKAAQDDAQLKLVDEGVATTTQPAKETKTSKKSPQKARRSRKSTAPSSNEEASQNNPCANMQDEVRLLREGQRFLKSTPERSLQLIRRYQSQCPKPALEPEFAALRVLALCKLGREEGAKSREYFLTKWPNSPQTKRVEQACR